MVAETLRGTDVGSVGIACKKGTLKKRTTIGKEKHIGKINRSCFRYFFWIHTYISKILQSPGMHVWFGVGSYVVRACKVFSFFLPSLGCTLRVVFVASATMPNAIFGLFLVEEISNSKKQKEAAKCEAQ